MDKEEGISSDFKREFHELEREIFTSFKSLMRNISEHFFTPRQNSLFEENLYKKNVCNGTMNISHICNETDTILVKQIASFSVSFIACILFVWIFNKHVLKSQSVSTIVNFLTCYLIILPCLPGIALFYATIAIFRIYIWSYFFIFFNGKRFLAGAVDSFWCTESHGSSSASVGLYIVEGKCNPERIRKRMESVVFSDLVGGKMERKSISFLGFACWEKVKNFNIHDHVKVVLKESSTPSKPTTDSQLFTFLQSLQDHPIKKQKSPWEVLIVPHFAYENCQAPQLTHYAVIFRLHHGIMDGVSSGNILHSIIADKPFKFAMDPLESVGKKVSKFFTVLYYIAAFFNLPHSGLRNILVLDNQHNSFFLPGKNTQGPKEFLWTRPINMDTLKRIKNSTKTSIFSLMLSCMGGAYGQIKGKEMEHVEFIHSISPVALLPYPDRKPRNGFSGILFPVAIDRFLKPRERLHVIYNLAKFHATHMTLIGNYYLIIMFGLMPKFCQSFGGPLVHLKCTLSNIPGPAETVRVFQGDRLSDICFWLPIKWTVGFGMGLISYGDRMRATIITDKTAFPIVKEVNALKSEFENQLILLGRSVGINEKDIFVPI